MKLKTLNLTVLLVAILVLFPTIQIASSGFQGAFETLPRYFDASMPYSYLVETNGTHAFMMNGTTHQMEASSTDHDDVINWVIANTTNGGDIKVKSGTYSITTSITDQANNDINFICEEGVVFEVDANVHCIYLTSCANWRIENLEIDGNKASRSGELHGIYLSSVSNTTIERCHIYDVEDHCIQVVGGAYNKFKYNLLENSDDLGIGVYSGGSDDLLIEGNTVIHHPVRGIFVESSDRVKILKNIVVDIYQTAEGRGIDVSDTCNDVIISENHLRDCAMNQLNLSGVYNFTVSDNWSYNGTYSGIHLSTARDGVVSGNVVVGCATSGTNTGIHLYNANKTSVVGNTVSYSGSTGITAKSGSSNCTFVANICYGNAGYGIYLQSGANGCIVLGNDCQGNTNDGIRDSGTGNIVEHNQGTVV